MKSETKVLWHLVQSQLLKTKESFLSLDKNLAREVIFNNRKVNAYELKIALDCENILSSFKLLADDLRFLMAVFKINLNLKQIGDNAQHMAKFVINIDQPVDEKLLKLTRVLELHDQANKMFSKALEAFEKEDANLAKDVYEKRGIIDSINQKANSIISNYIKNNKENIEQSFDVLSMIRKLERVGVQIKNMATGIAFLANQKFTPI